MTVPQRQPLRRGGSRDAKGQTVPMGERVGRAWRRLRYSDAFIVIVLAWAGIGVWGGAHPEFGSPAFWVAWFVPFALWAWVSRGLVTCLSRTSHRNRGPLAEVRSGGSFDGAQWREESGPCGRSPSSEFPMVCSAWSSGPPAFNRIGSLTALVVCAVVGCAGLKAVDAWITRRHRDQVAGTAVDTDRWRWTVPGEIVAVVVIVILLATAGLVVEWLDDDGPSLRSGGTLRYAGLGSLILVPAVRALRRWDRQHPLDS